MRVTQSICSEWSAADVADWRFPYVTHDERANAIAEFGFTLRQARFLTLVMRHAGVCLLRQYSAFAGIVHGQKTRAFFERLITRRYASAYRCRHNRGRLYHVHHFALYRAINEPNSAHRRPVPAGRIAERLMMLDTVLASPELEWLTTTAEKVAYFAREPRAMPVETLPRLKATAGPTSTPTTFPDRLPIGIAADGRLCFVYLVVPNDRDDFRAFLRRHTALFQSLPSWTLRLVFPRAIAHAYEGFLTVVRDELESPLHPRTIDELTWYFEQVRGTPNPSLRPTDERFMRAAEAFERPRFYPLYRRWLKEGERALQSVSSPLISEALAAGAARVESFVLPHRYDHLSPLATNSNPSCDQPQPRQPEAPGDHDPVGPRRGSWMTAGGDDLIAGRRTDRAASVAALPAGSERAGRPRLDSP